MAALDSIQRYIIMRAIWCENRHSATFGEVIDGSLVGVRIRLVVRGIGLEGDVKAVVDVADVLLEVLADRDEFLAGHTHHGHVADEASAAEIKHAEADHADFLVGC
jgi:hypothetical protein